MPRTPEFLDEALAEAEEAARWYAERDLAAAIRFSEALSEAISQIARAPDAWPPHQFGKRRILLRRFPFAVVYLMETGRVVVIAVAHTSRRPGYWRARADTI